MKTLKEWQGCQECGQSAKLYDSTLGAVIRTPVRPEK